jgi:hypothetical protein
MREAGMNTLELVLRERLLLAGRYTAADVHHMLDTAHGFGIQTVIRSHRQGSPSEDHIELVDRIVTALKTNHNILGWIVIDEPHSHPEIVQQAVARAKALDPRRPAWINVTPQGLGMRIAGLPGDAVMVDRYPVEFDGSTIPDVGIAAEEAARIAYEKGVPAWMILQSMSNSLWVWRSVTPEELTAQTYEAVVKGITGILFFTGIPLPQDTWTRMKELGRELRQLEPVLVSRDVVRVPCDNTRVNSVAKQVGDSFYLLAVNPHDTAQTAVFDLDALYEAGEPLHAQRLFPAGETAIRNRRLAATLGACERHVYRLRHPARTQAVRAAPVAEGERGKERAP